MFKFSLWALVGAKSLTRWTASAYSSLHQVGLHLWIRLACKQREELERISSIFTSLFYMITADSSGANYRDQTAQPTLNMSSAGTYRSTPKGKSGYADSPSNIPRPGNAREESSSSLSASRAKQSKRDEVCSIV